MIAVLLLIVPMMSHAEAPFHSGRDEFGRRCGLRLEPHLAVMIEDEWYADAQNVEFRAAIGGRGRTGRIYATLGAAGDATPAELELVLNHGRGTSFTLSMNAATYYVHACLLDD